MHILAIEDDRKVATALCRGLGALGHEAVAVHTGEEGFFLVQTQHYDLILLDLMLPGRQGLEILAALRRRGSTTPVLVLTAKDAVDDRVQALDAGADDYLVKPFAFPELQARIRALMRRGCQEPVLRLQLADLNMDLLTRRVWRGACLLELTAKEFSLLEYFLRHQGHIVSREMLARDIWHERMRATPLDNVIDVHIARLRRKLDDPFAEKLLHTVRGVGFSLRCDTP